MFFAIRSCDGVGRKSTITLSMLTASICCILVAFIPIAGDYGVTRIVVAFLGKFFITKSYIAFYTWTIEPFPTCVRGKGTGFVEVANKVWCSEFTLGRERSQSSEPPSSIYIYGNDSTDLQRYFIVFTRNERFKDTRHYRRRRRRE